MQILHKKILAAALAALMLLPATSCAEVETNYKADTGEVTTEAVNTADLLYADLPTETYDGYEFNVLQYKETSSATATVLTERTGNPIEDVIYERALTVEDRLDVKFVNHLDTLDGATNRLRNCIMGGLDEYDVFWNHSTTTVSNMLANGYLIDLNTLEALDFSKPWWDATATEYLALDDHTYMAFGDINMYLFDFHSAILFNKELTEERHLNLYEMVENGTWTMEEFIKLATDMALPATEIPDSQRYGFTAFATATMFGFLHGTGVNILTFDEDGIPELNGINEAYLDVLTTYNALFKNSDICNTTDGDCVGTFAAQKAAFVSCGVGQLAPLRNEKFDYGVLPFPKRDVNQKEYISFVTNQIQPMVVPKSASNTERTSVILENLAAESYRQVRPEYFEILLYSKYVRDPESLANVELLFTSETRFELEHIYSWSGLESHVINALTRDVGSFSSGIKSYGKSVNKAVAKTMDYLSKGTQ